MQAGLERRHVCGAEQLEHVDRLGLMGSLGF